MRRSGRLVVVLGDEEKKTIKALADKERLPGSTLARRILLAEAERRDTLPGFQETKPMEAHSEPAR